MDDNSVHSDVPGTVFNDSAHFFAMQSYVRPPSLVPKARTFHYFHRLATVLQAYPRALGHFVHETLPRLLYLLDMLPASIPVLVDWPTGDSTPGRYLDLLVRAGRIDPKRLVRWAGSGHVYYASQVYLTNEWPRCVSENPHHGGTTTHFPGETLRPVRDAFFNATGATTAARCSAGRPTNIIVVKRSEGLSRSLTNHNELMALLQRVAPSDVSLKEFTGDGALLEHVQAFQDATVIIAPHGAGKPSPVSSKMTSTDTGLSNMMFSCAGTLIIEIGYDGAASMALDDMFYKVATALGHRYWLLLAKGEYNTPMTAPLDQVLQVLREELRWHPSRASVETPP